MARNFPDSLFRRSITLTIDFKYNHLESLPYWADVTIVRDPLVLGFGSSGTTAGDAIEILLDELARYVNGDVELSKEATTSSIDFDRLWEAYPADDNPCMPADGSAPFPNQCAIRFSSALIDGGVDCSSFSGQRCYPGFGHNGKHLIRGRELADWMKRNQRIFGQVETKARPSADVYRGRRGLIFCENFWDNGNDGTVDGDHIDLWNGSEMKSGNDDYIDRSERVLFWQLD